MKNELEYRVTVRAPSACAVLVHVRAEAGRVRAEALFKAARLYQADKRRGLRVVHIEKVPA